MPLTRPVVVTVVLPAVTSKSGIRRSHSWRKMRSSRLASTARLITHDMDYNGAPFREGEMVLVLNMLHGLDERMFDHPLTVDFARPAPIHHAIFGNGPHTCPGAILARRELKVFLEEWLKRIPDFSVEPGQQPQFAVGLVNSVTVLPLVWEV